MTQHLRHFILGSIFLVLLISIAGDTFPTHLQEITIDIFARGVIEGDLNATLEQVSNTWLGNNDTPIPYKSTGGPWECTMVVGYAFILKCKKEDIYETYVSQAERHIGQPTDFSDDEVHYKYETEETSADEPDKKIHVVYDLEVWFYYECLTPSFEVTAEQSQIDVGDETKMRVLLKCEDEPMTLADIKLSLKGPGKLDSEWLSTEEGKDETIFHGTEAGLATITATYIPLDWRYKQCREVSAITEVSVGTYSPVMTITNKDFSDYHQDWGGPGVEKEEHREKNYEITVKMTFEDKPVMVLPERSENQVRHIYRMSSWEVVGQNIYKTGRGFHIETAPVSGKAYERQWNYDVRGNATKLDPISDFPGELEFVIDEQTGQVVEMVSIPAFNVWVVWKGMRNCRNWTPNQGWGDCSVSMDDEEWLYAGPTLGKVLITQTGKYAVRGYKKKTDPKEHGQSIQVLEWKLYRLKT